MKKVHQFENGIKVFDDQLLEIQRKRYEIRNVHEEDEEGIFISTIESLPANAIYVNIGTAIGYYPMLAKKIRNDLSIHCFEPLPRHLKYFKENLDLNGFNESDFCIHPIAISTQSGTASFIDDSYGSSLFSSKEKKVSKSGVFSCLIEKFVELFKEKKEHEGVIMVRTLGLSEIFQEIGSNTIDFIQMDIQGFEDPVLEAYFARKNKIDNRINMILVGTHSECIHYKIKKLMVDGQFQILHDEQDTKNQPDGIILGELGLCFRNDENVTK